MSYPTCKCDRHASDWIPVERDDGRTVRWEPDLKEVRPGVWCCWKCRDEPHPDMPSGYLSSYSK